METDIDTLIHQAVFSTDENTKKQAREKIREIAKQKGANLTSIHEYYMALGNGAVSPTSTVPAINVRMMTYDTARIIFRLMIKHNIGPIIFEIARTEMEYTDQRPDEFAVSVLAAAIKEGYVGPVFLQGDHFQLSSKRYKEDAQTEIGKIKKLIEEAISAGFLNIDIDASTLVDLSKENVDQQQIENFKTTIELTSYIRSIENGKNISVGAEIGHIGDRNSTPEDLSAFMKGFLQAFDSNKNGISKVAIQTGTSHGGIPLPGGGIADVKLDFSAIDSIGNLCRDEYKIGGIVQHGASTLPNELFGEFPKHKTLEIHLATGFQNIVYDKMPEELRNEMNDWTKQNCKEEWEKDWNEEQFIYKCRKKAIGPFKQKLWELSNDQKKPIINALYEQFEFLFEKLNTFNTKEQLLPYV